MTAPLVSILIPAYNREDLIVPCIQSALDQTVQELEVVVVDNESTDNTWQVCHAFAAKDKRVRVFRDPLNIGPVRNWQRCIQEARGRYGKILFSDDLIEPAFLERTLPFLQSPDVGFVFTAARIGAEAGKGLITYQIGSAAGTMEARDFIEAALFDGNVPVSPGCALFRMEDLRTNLVLNIPSPSIHDFHEHGAGPDLLLYLLTARNYPRVGHMPEPLAFFRTHPGSITISRGQDYIEPRYEQARIWFAKTYLDETTFQRLCTRAWLKTCKRRRRWIWPQQALRPFLEAQPPNVHLGETARVLRTWLRRAIVPRLTRGAIA